MAVQTTAPGGQPGEITAQPARGLSVANIWGEIRRIPIIPLFVLIVFLVIPAAFADVLAQHDHTIGDLDRVLEPRGLGPGSCDRTDNCSACQG